MARHRLGAVVLAFILAASGGCASVPEETVKLSYMVGQDLAAMQRSYDDLVAARFDDFRDRRIAYLENEWIPAFLEDWVGSGKLIEAAKGDVVWSDQTDDFVQPTPGKEEQQRLSTVLEWSKAAMQEIRVKRKSLIKPLDDRETAVRKEISDAFAKIRHANAQVTAQLNSIRRVQSVQDRATARLGARDLIADIDDSVERLSEWAKQGLEEVRKQDEKITNLSDSKD